MSRIETFDTSSWQPALDNATASRALEALEGGRILCFPKLRFAMTPEEARFLAAGWSGAAKNISYETANDTLKGTAATGDHAAALRRLMIRYAQAAQALLEAVIPAYRGHLALARTSFRPVEVAGRQRSPRQDDTRLHVDAFPSRPTGGRRILRVFSNVDAEGRPRHWRVGGPFETVARRFFASLPAPWPGSAAALAAIGLTKGRRAAYDHYMLRLHDAMKLDAAYQAREGTEAIAFPAGTSWIVFTDQVPHAAVAGCNALEQTFHLEPMHMKHPERSPLRVLEDLAGRSLA
ncbi:MAG: Kdo hydroxylase family protein [Pseudomonadota bacterium]